MDETIEVTLTASDALSIFAIDQTSDNTATFTSENTDDCTIQTVTATVSDAEAIITISKTSDRTQAFTTSTYAIDVTITIVYSKVLPLEPYNSLRIIGLSKPFIFGTHPTDLPVTFYTRVDELPFILHAVTSLGLDREQDMEATMDTDNTDDCTKEDKNIDATKETAIITINQTSTKTATITTEYTIT